MAELRQRKGKKKDDKNDEVVKDESDTSGAEASSEEDKCCGPPRRNPKKKPADYPKDIINIGGLYNLPEVFKKSDKRKGCAERCCATRWWIFMQMGVIIGAPGGLMYGLKWVLRAGKIRSTNSDWFWVHHIIFGYLALMFMWHFLKAMWGNGGKVTKKMVEKYQMPGDIPGRFKINVPEKYKDTVPKILQENLSFAPKYCQMCDQYKPPRTKHCSTCKQCTHRLDHHCPFLFNCVGSVNHGHFILFWIYGALATAYIVNVAIYCWFQAKPKHPVYMDFRDSPTMDAMFGWIDMNIPMRAGVSCFFTLFFGSILVLLMAGGGSPWFCSVGRNETQFDDEENDDPYDRYCIYAQVGKHNVYMPLPWDFLLEPKWSRTMSGLTGKYWYLTWFVPFCPAVIDWDAMLSPTASKHGWERFMKSIEKYEKKNGVKLSEIVQKANNAAPGLRTKCGKSVPAVKDVKDVEDKKSEAINKSGNDKNLKNLKKGATKEEEKKEEIIEKKEEKKSKKEKKEEREKGPRRLKIKEDDFDDEDDPEPHRFDKKAFVLNDDGSDASYDTSSYDDYSSSGSSDRSEIDYSEYEVEDSE